MKTKIKVVCLFALLLLATSLLGQAVWAVDEEALLLRTTDPDALIVLDLSGSMVWNPTGDDDTTGNADCTDMSSGSTDCSRIAIAKRALFRVLNDKGDGTLDASDQSSLGIRLGYMRFTGCGDGSDEQTGTYDYDNGCNKIVWPLGSKYSQIYCNSTTSCTSSSSASGSISGASASGGTPLASALREAKTYLDVNKAADTSANCRKKFVILITDGADTYACSGDGNECQSTSYKRRREVVLKAKALNDAGYKVFVIGLGANMPSYLQNTLNWMAYYGGTDNTEADNDGSTTALNLADLTSCQVDTGLLAGSCISGGTTYSINWHAPNNDPGYLDLAGYAYLADKEEDLVTALKAALDTVQQANYSFSQASVQTTRTADENYLYEASFFTQDGDPFWKGHLKKFQINTDGSVGNLVWDAGDESLKMAPGDRIIKTYINGALQDFTTAYITPASVGFTSGTTTTKNNQRNAVVGYIRGESAYNPETGTYEENEVTHTGIYKFGDVFRSTPVTIGSPSLYYEDLRDANDRYGQFRSTHPRKSTTTNEKRIVVVGANDGQLHAFKTRDGSEAWSFIPQNLLTKLKDLTHSTHPPTQTVHKYFVDGPITVSDAWLGTGTGKAKAADTWKTLLVFGLGRGGVNYSWSSDADCDAGINVSGTYSTTYKYYCGYHALDVTNSTGDSAAVPPSYLWHLQFADATAQAAQAPYLGDPWSGMQIGRVITKDGTTETEKWVGFIGGGYNAANCSGATICETRGKGFSVVDLSNGTILWSYTHGSNGSMDYSLPGTPVIVDTDNDGFIDTAYVGDLGGNMWRFKFCRATDVNTSSCGISGKTVNWSGSLFFNASTAGKRPIYTNPAVARDDSGNLWVYWGTGDKTDPTARTEITTGSGTYVKEYFYGLKDTDRTSTWTLDDLDSITTTNGTYSYSVNKKGYRLQLDGAGEKVLSDASIFGGIAYFTTFTPGTNACQQGGLAKLYALNYTSGTGGLANGDRSMDLGIGIASSPFISIKPHGTGDTPDLYVTVSGGSSGSGSTSSANTFKPPIEPKGYVNRTNMLYWRDLRVQ